MWRVYLSFLGIAFICALVIGRAVYIQRVQGDHWKAMSDSLHQRIIEIDAERGTIYSDDGQMLSTSLPTFDIYIDFMAEGLRDKNGKRFYDNLDSFSISLSKYFADKSASSYRNELTRAYRNKSRYYLLKKKLSFDDYRIFREFPLARLGRNRSGIIVEVNSKRLMPFGLLANRTIGLSREYVSSNGKIKKQNVGIEKSYDSLLTGQKGQRLVRFIAGGVPVPVDGYQVEPENGKDIVTTLNVNIQDITSDALLRMMQQSQSQYGTAIVMEVKTGKIKAIANLGRRSDGNYFEDNNYALNVTEPGSTIKLATLLAVLDEGKVKIGDDIEVGSAGRMVVGPRNVNDAERSPKPILNVKECFAHSSNVGMSKLAYRTFGSKPTRYLDYLDQYFLTEKLPIDLNDLPKPRLASLEKSNGGVMNMITMSFGYAIQVSPLHTLTLYNAVANNGRMMRPYLVNSIRQKGIPVKEFQPEILEESIARSSTIRSARECMEAVVTEGTAKIALKDMPFPVAGKTGTAHVADGKIKYSDGVYQASFVGYFPANDPVYSCIVVIRTRPHAAIHYGGQLAAPVFREIAMKLYSMYVEPKNPSPFRANPDSSAWYFAANRQDARKIYGDLNISCIDSSAGGEWCQVKVDQCKSLIEERRLATQSMPDLRGLGLKDAIEVTEGMGLRIQASGKGKVRKQSIAAGAVLAKGMTVYVELG